VVAVAAARPAIYDFNQSWLFGGEYAKGSADPGYDDSGFARVDVPHTVVPLSWGDWDHAAWEKVWIYRKHFDLPPSGGSRVFADFGAVMADAKVVLNGTSVASHRGGYLPFSAELTGSLAAGGNVLAVKADARWLPVPPSGAPGGAKHVDYLQPGGIYRDVALRVVPEVFLADVFAKPVDVLSSSRSVKVQATIDAGVVPGGPVHLTAELLDGSRRLARGTATVKITSRGVSTARLTLHGLGGVSLWSPESPKLYTVQVTLASPGAQPHTLAVTTGLRTAVFERDGFYLNGSRYRLFGLDRHQLFPYTGMAASARLQRRDAEILRYDLNCNMVRCSHYPQSPHFLDACDELGLMVWQEPPGWHYVGDAAWQDLAVQNVHDMIIRDRNRASVIVWATRLNETTNHTALYRRTRKLAQELDGSRQTTGAMDKHSTSGWAQDVFGYDDYDHSGGNATLKPPLAGVPYLVSEAVGAIDGPPMYRWVDTGGVLGLQAKLHGEAHSIARSGRRYAGLLGWCGFDYASITGGDRIWHTLKTPGVADTFRVFKPGAAIYRSQVSPHVRPMIIPAFLWDFGPGSPRHGPGDALIATNCDRLEVYVAGKHVASATPDRHRFGGLAHPPMRVNLTVAGAGHPELRIDGYLGKRHVATARMSADTSRDQLGLTVEDSSIRADGSDSTRVTFRALDAHGNQRPHVGGEVHLTLTGPGRLVGDNPFPFGTYGGVGGAVILSRPGDTGMVTVTARHDGLGHDTVRVTATSPGPSASFL
jgi:beta-galactosidase